MTRAADISRALAQELARPDAQGSPAVRRRVAEALAKWQDVAAVWPDLLTAAGRILTPEQRQAGTDREITPAGLLLIILARLAEVDRWQTGTGAGPAEGPQGWQLGERRDPQRLAAWLATPDRRRRGRLDRVARLARELAEALADCAGTDAAAELVAGLEPGEPIPLYAAEGFARGEELPRRLRALADHAAGLKLRPAIVERPNRDTARRTWWVRQIAARIATPETCEGMADAERFGLIAALAGAILNETVTPTAVYNSLK